ncbi:hypothetical protein CSA56_15855 [candidate division KSB3 bacterium]|uniref:Orc1-like AAA ATPase domain-containing protein n=1 Tax=candidate division KSB3 bacterium TaxID=2044937 RepID=A0A2G6K9K5_9BACT|nr:MAG: hypothetical protein CSA56_15855 [candidate division KSB3 bacterium]
MDLTFPGMLYNTDSKLVQLATAYTTSPVDTPSEQQKQHGKSAVEKHSLKRLQILLIVALLLTLGGFFVSSLIPQMAGVNVKSSRSRKLASQKAGARITSSRTRKPVFSTGKNGSRVRTTNRPKKVVHQMAGVGTGAVASRTSGVAPRMYETSIGSLTDLTSAYAAPSKVTATKKAPKLQVASDNILQDIPDKILLDAHDPERKNATLSSLPDASPTLLRMAKSFFHQSDFEYTSRSGAHGVLRATIAQYKRYGDIPVFFLKKTGFNETLLQEISNSLSNRGHKSHGKIAFMIVDEPLHASHYRQLYAVKSEHHITIIPISCDIIARSVKNSTCAQTMENLLSSMLTPKNLYESNRPINNPLEFFGRDELLHSLLDSAGHLQHIGLFGLRGIGKTSLVWQLREHLSRDVVAYIDLQHIPHDCSYLYQSILQECLKDASFKYPDVKLPKCDCADGMPEEKQGVIFLQTLVKLWEALKVGRHDMKIVLLLDEAESFVPGTTEHETGFAGFHEFMGIIRGISEQYGFLVSVVVSSRPEISRLDTWNGQSNPGFQFYKEVFLSSLPETGCNQMISSLGAQMGLTFTEEALSRIYYETGGHPYVTRQLCGLITEKSKERHDNDSWQTASERVPGTIQVQEVEDAISEYIEHKSDYLDSVWQRLSSIEQEILLTILTNHSCALKDLITPTQNYDAKRQHRKAISTLIENEIIEKCENKYSLRMGLFERFLLSSN